MARTMAPKLAMPTQKIHPCLWFDNQGLEAAQFYTSVFSRSPTGDATTSYITKESSVIITFKLNGQEFSALNGGPHYKHSAAISMFVTCDDQEEVDYFWSELRQDGGKEIQCGWLEDKFGVSWQVVPKQFIEMVNDDDPARAKRVNDAMLKCIKIDVKSLKDAYDAVSS